MTRKAWNPVLKAVLAATCAAAWCPLRAADAGKSPAGNDSPVVFVAAYALMAMYVIGGSIWVAVTLRASPTWSLGGALSDNGSPSSSRLIALLGALMTMGVLSGIGCYAIWRLLTDGTLPPLTSAMAFAGGGATLFAPYLANQVKDGMSSLAGAAPALSVNPPSVPNGTQTSVTVTGAGFQNPMVVSLVDPAGAAAGTVTGVLVASANVLIASVTANPSAAGKSCNLVLTGPAGQTFRVNLNVT
jgi:hypothetical protein